jgi:uncharacterized membrane protein YqhA
MVNLLFSLRYLIAIASLGAFGGALVMFWVGSAKLVGAVRLLTIEPLDTAATITAVMGSTDSFLFGIVLIIFASAVMSGFVVDRAGWEHRLPRWMRVRSLRELKYTLVEVILVYLVVDTATDLAAGDGPAWTALIKPAAILAIAGAMRLLGGEHGGPGDAGADEGAARA